MPAKNPRVSAVVDSFFDCQTNPALRALDGALETACEPHQPLGHTVDNYVPRT